MKTFILLLTMLSCSHAQLLKPESHKDDVNPFHGVESAKTADGVKKSLAFVEQWKTFEWKGKKLLVGLSVLPTDSTSYIDIHGYLFDEDFKEWRRFLHVKTHGMPAGIIELDEKEQEIYLLAKGNTAMKNKKVFRFSLLLL